MSDDAEPVEAAVSTRLMNALQALHDGDRLTFIGGSGYTVQLDHKRECGCSVVRWGTAQQMWSWFNGYQRGVQLPGEDGWWRSGGVDQAVARLARARDQVAEFRQLVLDPPLADAIRIQVMAAMEHHELNAKDLAERIGKSDQSVRDALLFGGPSPRIGNTAMLDAMLRSMDWPLYVERPAVARGVDVVTALSGERREPSGVSRMRALVIAVERRLIDGVSPNGLQRARRAREFQVSVAGHDVTRPRETLIHWLRGLADGAGDCKGMRALNLSA